MFRFKQFTIHQDRTPMKVGTDGVLLGAWAAISKETKYILDIGTGTGVIALMMAQRSYTAHVMGVDINAESTNQARENVADSPWADRVSVECRRVQEFQSDHNFDLIVSNPPYFVNALQSNDKGRTDARHTTTLPFEELISNSVRLLSPMGLLAIILPPQETKYFDSQIVQRLHLKRRCEVFSREGKGCKRIMSEYTLDYCMSPIFERLIIEEGIPPTYTAEYKALTRDFYLKF